MLEVLEFSLQCFQLVVRRICPVSRQRSAVPSTSGGVLVAVLDDEPPEAALRAIERSNSVLGAPPFVFSNFSAT